MMTLALGVGMGRQAGIRHPLPSPRERSLTTSPSLSSWGDAGLRKGEPGKMPPSLSILAVSASELNL